MDASLHQGRPERAPLVGQHLGHGRKGIKDEAGPEPNERLRREEDLDAARRAAQDGAHQHHEVAQQDDVAAPKRVTQHARHGRRARVGDGPRAHHPRGQVRRRAQLARHVLGDRGEGEEGEADGGA